ncbi:MULTISPECIES: helix-turn-helix domain-containing protein [Achromobacter]|uniref:MarR family transcriptional regulator n=1 Tax=Alcaligenes xylosoxydans xylosoxydans TaxID=85698 RepID=A0A424WHK0_ALCXX|nr:MULTISPECIES: helix-turn-helix domain-containing protein [Achromobacter]MBC9902841.1 winged helix-turn-helix transcriptional regulator [Achromobacter xylosoxidans]MBD0868557.1 winged helix-turn-helix transcriptional regulator [Achromobacter xylosoxidans]QNP83261.1 winged helix-turn-helix transcriptional regulator [Achromobacter xylosoxidans]RPJ92707.1 MarR family transcriptional regulator [Achromobacter xylosoxidans]WLW59091.1 helix-turn-helix domain-containing protein [Achromobacter aegrif
MKPPPPPPQLTATDYELLADFRYALRRFAAFSENAAAGLDLMPQQHQALLAIKGTRKNAPGRRGLYVGEIAERLLIRPHTAAELVGRLARLDLVSREADPEDGRRVEVVLTAKAERMLEDLSASHLEELRAMRPLLTRLLTRIGDDSGNA